MLRDKFNHGFDEQRWEDAKEEARQVMYNVARRRRTIAYSDLVSKITSVQMDAHDVRLAHFLGEIALEDDDSGLGLTTVVVVHKQGDQQPGPGFFEMAQSQGRNTADPVACWVNELNAVYDHWA